MVAWAGLWDGVHGQAYALTGEPTVAMRNIARNLAPQGTMALGAVGVALTGAAVGANASVGIAQVTSRIADGMNLGGQVPISTTSLVNRATTAADEAAIDAQLQPKFAPLSYPVDKSGNGGGGKTTSY